MKKKLQQKTPIHKVLIQTTKNLPPIIDWIHANLSEFEEIEIYEWFNNRYYVVVKDTRKGWPLIEDYRFGLTIDIKNDVIIWNQINYNLDEKDQITGNCFVRTNKWKTLVLKKFGPGAKTFEEIHWYQNCYLKKGAKKCIR